MTRQGKHSYVAQDELGQKRDSVTSITQDARVQGRIRTTLSYGFGQDDRATNLLYTLYSLYRTEQESTIEQLIIIRYIGTKDVFDILMFNSCYNLTKRSTTIYSTFELSYLNTYCYLLFQRSTYVILLPYRIATTSRLVTISNVPQRLIQILNYRGRFIISFYLLLRLKLATSSYITLALRSLTP